MAGASDSVLGKSCVSLQEFAAAASYKPPQICWGLRPQPVHGLCQGRVCVRAQGLHLLVCFPEVVVRRKGKHTAPHRHSNRSTSKQKARDHCGTSHQIQRAPLRGRPRADRGSKYKRSSHPTHRTAQETDAGNRAGRKRKERRNTETRHPSPTTASTGSTAGAHTTEYTCRPHPTPTHRKSTSISCSSAPPACCCHCTPCLCPAHTPLHGHCCRLQSASAVLCTCRPALFFHPARVTETLPRSACGSRCVDFDVPCRCTPFRIF